MASAYAATTSSYACGAWRLKNPVSCRRRPSCVRCTSCTLVRSRRSSAILASRYSRDREHALATSRWCTAPDVDTDAACTGATPTRRSSATSSSLSSPADPAAGNGALANSPRASSATTRAMNVSSTGPSQMTLAVSGGSAVRWRKAASRRSAARRFRSLISMATDSVWRPLISSLTPPRSAWKPRSISCILARMASHRSISSWRPATCDDWRT
mmetsp:Transcript_6394/g.20497  ORF Transcript_6394/g.20497 Transcript_6394/m.20497 type:complete len:214 (-) Transcript_6394:375-1016(-)